MTHDSAKHLITISFNDMVRFKPTAQTLRRFEHDRRELMQSMPNLKISPTMTLDAEGYRRDQLWGAVSLLAPECKPGGQATEDGNLIIEVMSKDLPNRPSTTDPETEELCDAIRGLRLILSGCKPPAMGAEQSANFDRWLETFIRAESTIRQLWAATHTQEEPTNGR